MRVRLLVAASVLAAACGGSDGSPTPPVTPPATNKGVDVYTIGTSFSPSFVQVATGDTVRFNIAGSTDGHDVTFDAKTGAPANIKVTLSGVVARVFSTRGTFHYNCFVHPGMSGDVVVQ